MSLIDRYVAEVGRHLPEKDRTDIEAEIRTMVEDTLEERGSAAVSSADDKVVTEVLEELGDPRSLAARYAPPKSYLVGPGWYDVYTMILRSILVAVLPLLAAVTIILTLAVNPLDFLNAIFKAFAGAYNIGVQIFFWVTIVFVLMERSGAIPGEHLKTQQGKWTVAQLPEIPRRRQISLAESLTNIVFLLFVMIWIVLPAVLAYFQGESGPLPFLNPDLWNFWLPLLLVIMLLTLVHDIFQLKIGNWTRPLMITNVILGIISIIYIAALVLTQDVINPAFLATMGSTVPQNTATWATWSANITAAIIIGIYVYDIVNSIRLWRRYEIETERA